MLTIDALKAYGADTQEGLARCFNNEAFYLRLVGMGLADRNFDRLHDAVTAGNAKEAFEAVHALKGAIGNLSLTPIYKPICALTEKLRGAEELGDIQELVDEVETQLARARAL